jgi:hypothetical protein
MVERSWESLEYPILRAVGELEDTVPHLRLEMVADATGLPLEDVRIGVRRLLRTDMLDGRDAGAEEPYSAIGLRLEERGRRVVGQWPADAGPDLLLEALEERIQTEQDEENRSLLERFRNTVRTLPKDVMTAVLVGYAKKLSGLE